MTATSGIPTTPDAVSRRRRAKFAVIGGGSLYSTNFLLNLARQAEDFRGSHITLMDRNRNKDDLKLNFDIGSRLLQDAATDITIEQTTSQKEAISDADLVIIAFRIGGMQASSLDEKIPLRHGLIGHERVGAGGFFYALRTIPVVATLAAEMEKTTPRAFLLNAAMHNSIVTEAITHYSGIRIIGLSDAPSALVRLFIQETGTGLDTDKRLYLRTIGLGDSNWTTEVWHDGRDILPELINWATQYAQQAITAANYEHVLLALLTAQYKALPSSFLYHYYFPERVISFLQQKATSQAEDSLLTEKAIRTRLREEIQKDAPNFTTIKVTDEHDFLLEVMRSLTNNRAEEWVLNVPNNGAINFLADDRVIEVPCRVDARGAVPYTQNDGGIAIDQRGLLYALAEYEGAAATAALWGNRRDATRALAANPLVMSYDKAEAVYDELASAHKQYIPKRLLT